MLSGLYRSLAVPLLPPGPLQAVSIALLVKRLVTLSDARQSGPRVRSRRGPRHSLHRRRSSELVGQEGVRADGADEALPDLFASAAPEPSPRATSPLKAQQWRQRAWQDPSQPPHPSFSPRSQRSWLGGVSASFPPSFSATSFPRGGGLRAAPSPGMLGLFGAGRVATRTPSGRESQNFDIIWSQSTSQLRLPSFLLGGRDAPPPASATRRTSRADPAAQSTASVMMPPCESSTAAPAEGVTEELESAQWTDPIWL